MKVEDVESRITSKTVAIMIVHIYGITVNVDPILMLAKKYNLRVIEDAAEVIGQTYKDQRCGSFGDISIFSFYPNKHITTGEGGMVLSDNLELDQRAKKLRNLCFSEQRFIHDEIGFNYRMTNMQAALGVAQLERIEQIVDKKRLIGSTYNLLLDDLDMINLPVKSTDYCENIYWVYAITLKDHSNTTARQVMSDLAEYKIGTRPFFYPIHQQPVYRKQGLFLQDSLPNSEKLYNTGFYIPSGLALTSTQMKLVSEALHEVLK
jgi:perosamine synthetase